jgi:putative DNA primase/helicase
MQSLRMKPSLPEILSHLRGARKIGSGWIARCPAHEDQHPSLSITERDGTTLLFCHAGCSYSAIMKALRGACPVNGNGSNGNHPTSRVRSRDVTAAYDYCDENGLILYQIVRIELTYSDERREKTFRFRRGPRPGETAGPDGWIYSKSGIKTVLYNLPRLKSAELVYVVEGEKDVDTLSRHDLAATCNPFGAGKWRAEYNESLRGKTVAILPDNDSPGRAHAESVATALHGIAREVLVINLPNLGPQDDVTDYLIQGGTPEDLMGYVERAESWVPKETQAAQPPKMGFVFTPLKSLLAEEPEELAFVWDLTLPTGGFSICSAKPKVGKSTLARNLAIAVACGTPFLGRETNQGTVLYLCLEEKRSEVRKHFAMTGAKSENIFVYTGSTPKTAIADIALAIEEFKPALVIIDPLSRVIRVSDFNDYGSMSRGLEPLIDLARRTGTHILCLHHDSKMDRSGGDALLVNRPIRCG